MRRRLIRITAGLSIVLPGLLLTGCGEDDAGQRTAVPPPRVVDLPASAAGGACQLLDYPVIEEATGVRFDVAASGTHSGSHTCVIRSEAAERPELALAVSKTKTRVDAAVFKEEVAPGGGKNVSGLGKAAYRATLAPGKDHGAGVEVGWLTGDGRLISLRYVLPSGEDRAAADEFAAKVVALAKRIDAQKIDANAL